MRYQSEDLAASLVEQVRAGERVLLARADRGRDVLREVLSPHCDVEQVAVYSQTDAVVDDDAMLKRLRRGEIDFIPLTSSNIARSLFRGLDDTTLQRIRAGEVNLVSISPVTSEVIRSHDLPVAAEASDATVAGVLEALVTLAAQKRCRPSD